MTTIAALPPAPQPSDDEATFNSKAFTFNDSLATFVTQANAVASETNAAASAASTSAGASATSQAAALVSELASATNADSSAASAGASIWVSGTTYAIGDPRWSPLDRRVYRRRTAGAGTTDPSLDTTNWAAVAPNGLAQNPVGTTSASCPIGMDTCFTNSAACAATAPASPAVNDTFGVRFDNGLTTNTLDLGSTTMVGPNGLTLTGVVTLNVLGPLKLRWWSDNKWRTA